MAITAFLLVRLSAILFILFNFLQDTVHRACDTATDSRDRPLQEVKIVDSGSLAMDEPPFLVDKTDALS